eukprot:Amastigsp_a844187_23.p2 type:complete len:613 gc:universal Amastigsp_a844187_23:1-1839(+)
MGLESILIQIQTTLANMKKAVAALLLLLLALSAQGRIVRVPMNLKGEIQQPTHPFAKMMRWGPDPANVEDAGGGSNCAACTIVVGLLEQMAEINGRGIEDVLDKICSYFPAGVIQDSCTYFVNTYGEDLITMILNKETADEVCADLKVCTNYPTCMLFPAPTEPRRTPAARLTFEAKLAAQGAKETPWDFLKALINKMGNLHEPIVDLDDDLFSTESTLRGDSWRGFDCHDTDNTVYPGRVASSHPASVDFNCNGILGTDPNTDKSYESELCSGPYQGIGTVVVGDSAGAHFELPPNYFTAAEINATTFLTPPNILYRLENEFDIPYRSFGTGFLNSSTNEPVVSIYEALVRNNLCNWGDYQNLGVNGARSGSISTGSNPLMKDIARDPQTDKPVLMIFELVGNDVCNGHVATTEQDMTTVPEFKANVLAALDFFDTVLPAGSHIAFVGLAPGWVLYDSLYNRTHPIGVPYTSVYNFLNCLQISPCTGWMTTNATLREFTDQRSINLSAVYPEIVAEYSSNYTNFDMDYFSFVDIFNSIITTWEAQGGQTWQLIEPVDGFHPNQFANALIAQELLTMIQATHPDWLGPVNPNNAKIAQLFAQNQQYHWTPGK